MRTLLKANPLFTVFLIPIVVDVIGTVLGQPVEYWTSGYQIFNEAVPIYPLLQIHPLLFIAVTLVIWLAFTYWLIRKLRYPYNVWGAMALLVGHGYNSVTWLRIDLYRAGLFTSQDQMTKALSLVPMTIYILLVSWVAMKGMAAYIDKRRGV